MGRPLPGYRFTPVRLKLPSEEVARRLADVIAAEEAIEMSLGGDMPEDDPQPFTPQGSSGRYVEPQIQAAGGMGVLCLARDVELGRAVAYKVMRPGQDRNPTARERFFNEAQITAGLAHPGIVPVFGRVIDDSGLPAYASEFVSGKTLQAEILRLHAMSADDNALERTRAELLRVFIAACQIIAYAHSKNVVHGDIKPSNIMIDDFGATRVVDWGVARIVNPLDQKSQPAALPTPRPGTPHYISSFDTPSSVSGDIYALGQTLLWILKDERKQSPGIDAKAQAPSSALGSIVQKAMHRDHDARYQSAGELARDTQAVLDDKAISAYRDPLMTRDSADRRDLRTSDRRTRAPASPAGRRGPPPSGTAHRGNAEGGGARRQIPSDTPWLQGDPGACCTTHRSARP